MVLMPDFDALIGQPAQAAIAKHNPFGGPLVEAQDAFKGYGWYDILARVEDMRFRVTQGDRTFIVSDSREAPAEAENGWVEAITLEATMSHAGAFIEVSTDANVAFAPDQWSCNSVDETSVFVRRAAKSPRSASPTSSKTRSSMPATTAMPTATIRSSSASRPMPPNESSACSKATMPRLRTAFATSWRGIISSSPRTGRSPSSSIATGST
jgi:hypothetical protein